LIKSVERSDALTLGTLVTLHSSVLGCKSLAGAIQSLAFWARILYFNLCLVTVLKRRCVDNPLFIEKYQASVKRSIDVSADFAWNRSTGIDMQGDTC
jgi:hypothetical protein